jgi:threonine dehydrogenase-like Zn-dependent dehydrogenase
MSGQSCKRAVLTAPHLPIEVWENSIPPVQTGEVIVRVLMGGVCGTDVHFWQGDMPLPGPLVLGHEGIGVIDQLGEGLTTDFAGESVGKGDRVYWVPLRPCHHCYYCTVQKDLTLCENAMADLFRDAKMPPSASYSEYSWFPAGMPFYRIPDDTPSEAVIAFGCAMPTMLQGMERLGGISVNQTVVVQGCGPVGLAATLLAKISGARQIIVIGAPKQRLEMASRLGATHTINLEIAKSEEERIAQVRDLTGGRGADVVIEAAGVVTAFGEGLKIAAKNGRYLVVGLWSAPGTVAVEPRYINNNNLRIIGTALYQSPHLHGAIQVARKHHREFPLAEAVTHRFALGEVQQALEAVAKLETIKAVIVPSTQ